MSLDDHGVDQGCHLGTAVLVELDFTRSGNDFRQEFRLECGDVDIRGLDGFGGQFDDPFLGFFPMVCLTGCGDIVLFMSIESGFMAVPMIALVVGALPGRFQRRESRGQENGGAEPDHRQGELRENASLIVSPNQ